jgi:spermidine synthase
MSPSRRLQAVTYILFFVSGLTGLIYQVAWARMFSVVFGNTTLAVSTVLAAFMGGLALGSLILGRAGDRFQRPVFAYGILEILIGLFAFLFPWLIARLQGLYSAIFAALEESTLPLVVIRFTLSFLLILLPTTLMGGTLPILSKFAAREIPHVGRRIGGLYAVNTFGAVLGTVCTGFLLLEFVGVRASVYLSGSMSLLVGILATLAGRRSSVAREQPPVPGAAPTHAPSPVSPYRTTVVLTCFALSGAVALAYEVLYTRVLVFTLGSSSHAFSVMLATFLVGIAVGSLIVSLLVDRWRNLEVSFGIVEISIGIFALGSVWILSRAGETHQALGILRIGGGDILLNRGASFLQAALAMLVPALLMGATFPIVTRFSVRTRERASFSIGKIYFFNTVGAVVGSLVAGFLLVPFLGTARSFALAASLNVALGLWLFSCRGARKVWIGAAATVLVVSAAGIARVDPAVFRGTYNIGHEDSDLAYFREGVNGTVTVHRYPLYDLIAVDGVDVAGTNLLLRITQKLQAHLPVLLAGHPQKVAHIGFGSGETLRVLTLHDIPQIHGIEICREIVAAAKQWFGMINRNAFERPEVDIIFMDGKNYVLLTDETYDLIMTDSVYPGVGQTGSALYTYDHFRAARDKLRSGGILSCWMPLDVSNRDLKMALRAFHEAFPHMTVWYGYSDVTKHALFVGRKDAPIELDFARFVEAYDTAAVKEDLDDILVSDPYDLTSCLLLDGPAIERLCEGIPLNTDDRPLLEFGIARRGLTANYLVANLEEALGVRADPRELLVNVEATGADPDLVAKEIERRMKTSARLIRGHMAMFVRDPGSALRHYHRALELDPESEVAATCAERLDRERELMEVAATDAEDGLQRALRLGESYLTAGRLEDAAAQLAQACALQPDAPASRVRLAECYLRLGNAESALEHLLVARDLAPDDAGTHYYLGLCHEQSGKPEEAKKAYERALESTGWNYRAYMNLGKIHLAERNLDAARRRFTAAHELAPGKPFAQYNLGLTYAQEKRWAEAIARFEEATEIRPTFHRAHFELGNARFAAGDREGAIRAWERTLALEPGHEGARQRLERHRSP